MEWQAARQRIVDLFQDEAHSGQILGCEKADLIAKLVDLEGLSDATTRAALCKFAGISGISSCQSLLLAFGRIFLARLFLLPPSLYSETLQAFCLLLAIPHPPPLPLLRILQAFCLL